MKTKRIKNNSFYQNRIREAHGKTYVRTYIQYIQNRKAYTDPNKIHIHAHISTLLENMHALEGG